MMRMDDVVAIGKTDVPECPQCGADFIRALIRFEFEGQLVGYYPADVCDRGHRFLTQESSRAIDATLKRRGLWGTDAIGPRTIIIGESQSGSALMRIPSTRLRKKEQGVSTSDATVTALDDNEEARVSVDVVTA